MPELLSSVAGYIAVISFPELQLLSTLSRGGAVKLVRLFAAIMFAHIHEDMLFGLGELSSDLVDTTRAASADSLDTIMEELM